MKRTTYQQLQSTSRPLIEESTKNQDSALALRIRNEIEQNQNQPIKDPTIQWWSEKNLPPECENPPKFVETEREVRWLFVRINGYERRTEKDYWTRQEKEEMRENERGKVKIHVGK